MTTSNKYLVSDTITTYKIMEFATSIKCFCLYFCVVRNNHRDDILTFHESRYAYVGHIIKYDMRNTGTSFKSELANCVHFTTNRQTINTGAAIKSMFSYRCHTIWNYHNTVNTTAVRETKRWNGFYRITNY